MKTLYLNSLFHAKMRSLRDLTHTTLRLQTGTHQNSNTAKLEKSMTTFQYETSYFHKSNI